MVNSRNAASPTEDVMELVSEMIRSVSEKARCRVITAESLLLEELALDSLDLVRVIMLMEDRFNLNIDLDEVSNMKRAGDLASLLPREERNAA